MTTTIEFESDTLASNILGRLAQWGYELELVDQSGDDLKYEIGEADE